MSIFFVAVSALNSLAFETGDRVELGWGQTVTVNSTVVACQAAPSAQLERKVFKKYIPIRTATYCSTVTPTYIAETAERARVQALTECFEDGYQCTLIERGPIERYLMSDNTLVEERPQGQFQQIQCDVRAIVFGERLRTQ